MKNTLIGLLMLAFLSACSSGVKINESELKKVKKVAVVVFTLKKSIEYRDEPTKDDSDFLALTANTTAAGSGENAATLALPQFIRELDRQMPFKVLTVEEMRANKKFMALYTPPKEVGLMGALGSFFVGGPPAESARGFMNFGLPSSYDEDDGEAIMGEKGEMKYIKAAMEALKVDAALIIVDRGTSFQCNLLCLNGGGQASMGGAFHSVLLGRNGQEIVKLNTWFEGEANALMGAYIVEPLERDYLYKEHGKKMAKEWVTVLRHKD